MKSEMEELFGVLFGSVYLQVDMRIDQRFLKPREGARFMYLHVQHTRGWLVAHTFHRKGA